MTIALKRFIDLITPKRITFTVYSVLWGLALVGAAISYWNLQKADILGFGDVMAIVYGGATFFLQLAVYLDLHKIEEKSDQAQKDYRGWLNHPLERWMRLGIMFALLFGVGKIATVFQPFLQYDFVGFQDERRWISEALSPANQAQSSHSLFVIGSIVVFLLLLAWNLFAWSRRSASKQENLNVNQDVEEAIVSIRIRLFCAIAALCMLYWFFLFKNLHSWVVHFSELLIFFYSFMVLAGWSLRYKWSQVWLKKPLTTYFTGVHTLRDSKPIVSVTQQGKNGTSSKT